MLHQIVKAEDYVPEMIQVVSKMLILTMKEPRRMVHLMRHASKNTQNMEWANDPAT